MNRANYEEIDGVVAHLKGIVANYPIKRGSQIPLKVKDGLRRDFTAYLDDFAASSDPRYRDKILSFERELLEVLNGTTKSDVTGSIGLKGFYPKERRWKLPPIVKPMLTLREGEKDEPASSKTPATDAGNRGELLPGDIPWALIKLLQESVALAAQP